MHRYFVTVCAHRREPIFRTPTIIDPLLRLLFDSTSRCAFVVGAYCFTPDHVHLLLLARSDAADLLECVRRYKQITAFEYKRRTERALWQPGYFARTLRNDEETETVARYILENPVRAGLSRKFQDYPIQWVGAVHEGRAM
jgi:REP element-mobilizing transposase RayT